LVLDIAKGLMFFSGIFNIAIFIIKEIKEIK
jgi:hypothetical protein